MKRLQNIFFGFFLLFFFQNDLIAKHIIGGDLSYECIGNDQYRFTMKVYRDCNSGGATLDIDANITVFEFENNIPIIRNNVVVPLEQTTDVEPEVDNPCLQVPSNLCVQEGIYNFLLNLPPNPDGYLVVYQRCCRNESISNIYTPGDVGASYTIFLSNEAMLSCNSSPVFNEFPPIVICGNEPLNFNHSATDEEGDSLVYSFCRPIQGASQSNPQPATASPPFFNYPYYSGVNFLPNFSDQYPMGGSPLVTIDSTTGIISGTPIFQGQYVVGVCIDEYRNGILLSSTRRDFQFNVTNCERLIIADILEDELVGPREYIVNSCGTNDVAFLNQSRQANYITGYLWEFEQGQGLPNVTSTLTNPVINFPNIGTYEGTLIVNPDNSQCSDTANIIVNVYPEIQSDFIFAFDSCELAPVFFMDQSFTGSNEFESWFWNFGDGTSDTLQHTSHEYTEAGSFDVRLTVVDTNECRSTSTQTIDWYPEAEIIVVMDEDQGCVPFTPLIINNSFPINGYTTTWDMGDGTIINDASPVHTYTEPGVYSLHLNITSPRGCVAEQFFPDLVTALAVPVADFEFSPENPTNFSPIVEFTDQSFDAALWDWDFGNGDFSTAVSPTYVYPDTGRFEVKLVVTQLSGCKDSLIKIVDVEPRYTYYLPNAFTPNFDDLNDGFRGAGIFYGIENFEMRIWNRWGEQVFHTNDPNTAWNGRKNNTGKLEQSGVYVYYVKLKGARNQNEEFKGFATLIR